MLNKDHRNSLGDHTFSFWASTELLWGDDHLGLLLRGQEGAFVKVCGCLCLCTGKALEMLGYQSLKPMHLPCEG